MMDTGPRDTDTLSDWIVREAGRLGFDACGISHATWLEEESVHVEQWLEGQREGEMGYLTRNKEKRYDPRLLVEGTRSIVTVLYNYFPKHQIGNTCKFKIAKYAYGADYHDVLKRKLRQLLGHIENQVGKMENCRIFVDSAPVLDRAWAVRSGLGFIGKNTSLIHPKKGSFFFIGHLFLPTDLTATGHALTNRCGRCTRCIDACPTGALEAPFRIDARKCISYLTIEHKGNLDLLDHNLFNGWMYGCDICQDVCPYNRFSLPNNEPDFQPSEALVAMREEDWTRLNPNGFEALFKHSAVKRVGFEGLKRNIDFIAKATGCCKSA